jgi:hypothetical protein
MFNPHVAEEFDQYCTREAHMSSIVIGAAYMQARDGSINPSLLRNLSRAEMTECIMDSCLVCMYMHVYVIVYSHIHTYILFFVAVGTNLL